MPFEWNVKNELKEKVKTKMVYDSIQQHKADSEKKSSDRKAWNVIKKSYEEDKEFAAKSIADIKFKLFKDICSLS